MAVFLRPYACAAGDEQLRLALAGDVDAQALLMRAGARRGLTHQDRVRLRDEAIVRVGRWLLDGAPGRTRNWAAGVLKDAGDQANAGRTKLRGPLIEELTTQEAMELAERLVKLLSWAPPTRAGRVWLDQRQLDKILARRL